MRYFAWAHLPAHLQAVSRPIGELAEAMDRDLPDGAEKSAGLRKLLEAKDCFVRAALDRPAPKTEFVWLAETADTPPRYATRGAPDVPVGLTAAPHEARRFASQSQCQEWIQNSAPVEIRPLVAREHGFG